MSVRCVLPQIGDGVCSYRNEEIPPEQRARDTSDFRVQKHFVPESGSTSEFVYAAARQSFALTIKFVGDDPFQHHGTSRNKIHHLAVVHSGLNIVHRFLLTNLKSIFPR